MNTYTAYNIVLGAILIPTGALMLRSHAQFLACTRASLIGAALAFPWQGFAQAANLWQYDAPGMMLYGVPVNDLCFIAICTFFSSALLSWRRAIHAG